VADAADGRTCQALIELASLQAKSSINDGWSRPCRTAKSGSGLVLAKRFHGHASWQSSQP
jgi:hypothetical protein